MSHKPVVSTYSFCSRVLKSQTAIWVEIKMSIGGEGQDYWVIISVGDLERESGETNHSSIKDYT